MTNVRTWLPATVIFPDLTVSFDNFLNELRKLSRTDTVLCAAHFNNILSNSNNLHIDAQQHIINDHFTKDQLELIIQFQRDNIKTREEIAILTRRSLLDMIRYASIYCIDFPDDGIGYNSNAWQSFFKCVLMLPELLGYYRMSDEDDISLGDVLLREAGHFRNSVRDNSPDILEAIAFGRCISLYEHLKNHLIDLDNIFFAKFKLTHDQFLRCALILKLYQRADTSLKSLSTTYYKVGSGVMHYDHLNIYGLIQEELVQFIDAVSIDIDSLGQEYISRHEDDCQMSWHRILRDKPIIKTSDKRFIVSDFKYLTENIIHGYLFTISPKDERNNYLSNFGKAYEDYANSLFHSIADHQRLEIIFNYIIEKTAGDYKEIDSLLQCGHDIILIESKARWLKDDAILDINPFAYSKELVNKYSESEGKNQLVNGIKRITELFEPKPRHVYSILTVYDEDFLHETDYQILLYDFHKNINLCSRADDYPECYRLNDVIIHAPIIVNISEIEHLESVKENVNFYEVVIEYARTCPKRNHSFYEYLDMKLYIMGDLLWSGKQKPSEIFRQFYNKMDIDNIMKYALSESRKTNGIDESG